MSTGEMVGRARSRVAVVLACAIALAAGSAGAGTAWHSADGGRHATCSGTLKWTSLLARAPHDAVLYPQRWSSTALWRGRAQAVVQVRPGLGLEAAYEVRTWNRSAGSGLAASAGMLPPPQPAPYRRWQLETALVEVGDSFACRHELDRAVLTARGRALEIQIGRQAAGWGRGTLFTAVDVFAPFAPLEADREWRCGMDLVRVSAALSARWALDAVTAFTLDASEALAGCRLHGFWQALDLELVAGRRRRDWLVGAAVSAPVAQAEIHGELALFSTPEAQPDGGTLGQDALVTKLVAGGSRSLDLGAGVLLGAEYTYSGFGLADVATLPAYAGTVLWDRLRRGDAQILGRHAVGVWGQYGLDWVAPVRCTWLLSPTDGSGVVSPAVSWAVSDRLSLLISLYLAHGAGPDAGVVRSEYGAVPASGLLQASVYL